MTQIKSSNCRFLHCRSLEVIFRDWETFRDLIKSMIIDRNDISNVAKLQYLKSCLFGEAADLIRTIPISEDNFVLAWNSLQSYYENIRRLTSAHLATLFDLKPMLNESASELRRIYSATLNPLLALEALQRPVNQWNDVIVFLTERRLDPETRRSWEIKLEGSKIPPAFQTLKEFLKTKITTLDSIESSCSGVLSRKPSGMQKQGKGRLAVGRPSGSPNAGSFHLTGRIGSSTPLCVLCGETHWLAFCDEFKAKAIQQRNDFVKSKNIYSNCFGNHAIKFCKSPKRCQKCNRKHHTLIHQELINSELPEKSNSNMNVSSVTVDASVNTSANVIHQIKGKPDSVLLSTAWVKVEGPHGNAVYARALIDQCAQSSFISESLSKT
ncbi:hypothetical protein J437_LFUL018867 [Ladona fulva]|uniref:Gag protein n=1 Tax=Ladona fulva TaxID=123851 RepID=A0A8K0KVU3_LADFU|nr:hypothetical protein J437_LFUL018867 [Ladona fulva]